MESFLIAEGLLTAAQVHHDDALMKRSYQEARFFRKLEYGKDGEPLDSSQT